VFLISQFTTQNYLFSINHPKQDYSSIVFPMSKYIYIYILTSLQHICLEIELENAGGTNILGYNCIKIELII
jgi:hypothetical protein